MALGRSRYAWDYRAGVFKRSSYGHVMGMHTAHRTARAERLTLAKEEYQAREERCESLGGAMTMRTRPLEKPGYLDYRSANCVRR